MEDHLLSDFYNHMILKSGYEIVEFDIKHFIDAKNFADEINN
jgi:hypothetical protein